MGQDMVKLWDSIPGFDFNSEIDLPELNSWFFDGTHSVPLLTPMYAWFWIRNCGHGSQYSAEVLSMPRYKGFTFRDMKAQPTSACVLSAMRRRWQSARPSSRRP